MLIVVGGIVVVAVIVLIAAIVLSGGSGTPTIDYSTLNPTRNADGAFVVGSASAPITIVEFADYGCPHCQEYVETMHQVVENYVVPGKARFEFRIFPTAGGQQTVFAGQMAECADTVRPGAFWQMHEGLYTLASSGRYYTTDGIRNLVQSLGLNYTDVLACSSTAEQVTRDINFGQSQQISGTPSVMVRYGDGPAQWISVAGITYNQTIPTYPVLAAVIDAANS
ncbi:MAG: thioredoxin domain-containing protein [Anaerolineae bacterium]